MAVFLLAACTTLVDRRLETLIERELPRIVGPAARYEASVSGADPDGSRLERVRVVGWRVERARAPVLDRVEAELQDVRVDRADARLAAVGAATARMRVLPQDVAVHLRGRRWFDDVQVSFAAPDSVVITGRPRFADLVLPPAAAVVETHGRLVPRGAQLRLELDDLKVAGSIVLAFWRGIVQLAINPVLDIGAFPAPARFDAVAFDGAAFVITASGGQVRR